MGSGGRHNTDRREGVAIAKRGRKRDLGRELQYWELLASGVRTVQACRQVGVSRKTGYRWRAEMGGVSATKRAPQSGRYLSLFERERIASLHERGHGVREGLLSVWLTLGIAVG